MKTYKKVLHVLSWIAIVLLHSFPLVLIWPFVDLGWLALAPVGLVFLGLVLVPVALAFDTWPKLLWLWGNDEEQPPLWFMKKGRPCPTWWWYAIRNPVNNLRFVFADLAPVMTGNWVQDSMEARDLIKAGRIMAYRWAWRGPFAGYRRVWLKDAENWSLSRDHPVPTHYSEIWFGWKVGSTVPGMGFTTQVRLNREVGK